MTMTNLYAAQATAEVWRETLADTGHELRVDADVHVPLDDDLHPDGRPTVDEVRLAVVDETDPTEPTRTHVRIPRAQLARVAAVLDQLDQDLPAAPVYPAGNDDQES